MLKLLIDFITNKNRIIMVKKILNLFVILSFGELHAAKEIELKVSLPMEEYAQVETWLKTHADYRGSSEQREYYLTKPNDKNWDYSAGFKDTLKTMRVRQEQKGDSFCYKYRHLDPITKKTTHRDEYETKIEHGDTMVEILKLLGYTEQTLVAKSRITYEVYNCFEVTFDDVHNIGKFIEIELKESIDDVKLGLAKIEALMQEMGISKFRQYDRGYIHMIWNPGYDFGIERTLPLEK